MENGGSMVRNTANGWLPGGGERYGKALLGRL